MKVCIVGGGPCGLYMAYELGKRGHAVELYEKENYIGGCWASVYHNNLFTEHAPRMFFDNYGNTIEFFKDIGIDFHTHFKKVFSVFIDSFSIINDVSAYDLLSLTFAYLSPLSTWKGYTVFEMCEYYNISTNGRKALNSICYTIDGVSMYKMTTVEFLDTIDKTLLYNGYESRSNSNEYMIPKIKAALKKYKVHIHTNTTLKYFSGDDAFFENNTILSKTKCDAYLICIPPPFFANALRLSDEKYKHAWGDFDTFNNLCTRSYYSGIGIQFHFDESQSPIHFKSKTIGEWHIISSYNVQSSCISCVIVDTQLKSTYLKKYIHDMSKDEIMRETWRQLMIEWVSMGNIVPNALPQMTMTQDLGAHGAFLYTGENIPSCPITNVPIRYVGSHNQTNIPFTSIEATIESAKRFLSVKNIYTPISFKSLLYPILFVLIYSISSSES